MKATARELRHLHRRGWTYCKLLGTWSRVRSPFDLAGSGRRHSLNMHNNAAVIHVNSASQAMVVDSSLKRRWDNVRQRDWPPELFGYAD